MMRYLISKVGILEKRKEAGREEIGKLARGLYRMIYHLKGDPQMHEEVEVDIDYETQGMVPYNLSHKMNGEQITGFHIILGINEDERRGTVDLKFRDGKAEYKIALEPLSAANIIPYTGFGRVEGMMAEYLNLD